MQAADHRRALDRRGVTWGLVGVAVVLAITFIGSDGLEWFDAALIGYLFGVVFAVFGVIYRYTVWLRRPPTAMLNRRGWDAFRRRKARNAAALPSLVATQLLANRDSSGGGRRPGGWPTSSCSGAASSPRW